MASGIDRRLDELEQAIEPIDRHVIVDWEGDNKVLDVETGERVTPDEWRRRHPGEQLVILRWEDVIDD